MIGCGRGRVRGRHAHSQGPSQIGRLAGNLEMCPAGPAVGRPGSKAGGIEVSWGQVERHRAPRLAENVARTPLEAPAAPVGWSVGRIGAPRATVGGGWLRRAGLGPLCPRLASPRPCCRCGTASGCSQPGTTWETSITAWRMPRVYVAKVDCTAD